MSTQTAGCTCCGCLISKYPFLYPDKDLGTFSTNRKTVTTTTTYTNKFRRTYEYDVATEEYTLISTETLQNDEVDEVTTVDEVTDENITGRATYFDTDASGSGVTVDDKVYDPPEAEENPNDYDDHTYYQDTTWWEISVLVKIEFRLCLTFDVSGLIINQDIAEDGETYEVNNVFVFTPNNLLIGPNDEFTDLEYKVYGVETDTAPPATSDEFDTRLASLTELSDLPSLRAYYDLGGLFTTSSTINILMYSETEDRAAVINEQQWSHSRPFKRERADDYDTFGLQPAVVTQNSSSDKTDWTDHFDLTEDSGVRTWTQKRNIPSQNIQLKVVHTIEGDPYQHANSPFDYKLELLDPDDNVVFSIEYDTHTVTPVGQFFTYESTVTVTGLIGTTRTFTATRTVGYLVGASPFPKATSLNIFLYDNTVSIFLTNSEYNDSKLGNYVDDSTAEEFGPVLLFERTVPETVPPTKVRPSFSTSSSKLHPIMIAYRETAPIVSHGEPYYYEEPEESDCVDPERNCTLIGTEESLNIKWDATAAGFSFSGKQVAGEVCLAEDNHYFGDDLSGSPTGNYFYVGNVNTDFTGEVTTSVYQDPTFPPYSYSYSSSVTSNFSIGTPYLSGNESLGAEGFVSLAIETFLSRASSGNLQLNLNIGVSFPITDFHYKNPDGYYVAELEASTYGGHVDAPRPTFPLLNINRTTIGGGTVQPELCGTGYPLTGTTRHTIEEFTRNAPFQAVGHHPEGIRCTLGGGNISWVKDLGIGTLERLSDLPATTFRATDSNAVYSNFYYSFDPAAPPASPTNIPSMEILTGVVLSNHNILEDSFTGASDCTPTHYPGVPSGSNSYVSGNLGAGRASFQARLTPTFIQKSLADLKIVIRPGG